MFNNACTRVRSVIGDMINDRKLLVRILAVILVLTAALIFRVHEADRKDITIDSGADSESGSELVVDIGGAVIKPGVYRVSYGTRLYEVIEIAGGLTGNADTESVNQAAFVEDGEKIIIPEQYEAADQEDGMPAGGVNVNGSGDDNYTSDNVLNSTQTAGRVNINTATREQLMTLNGIGEVMADRIIEYRSTRRFTDIEDIMSVKGIGDAKFSKIRDSITV